MKIYAWYTYQYKNEKLFTESHIAHIHTINILLMFAKETAYANIKIPIQIKKSQITNQIICICMSHTYTHTYVYNIYIYDEIYTIRKLWC